MLGLGVHVWLRLHFLPPALKYVSTGLDVLLLTLLLMVADGPRSPLIVGYFLIPALAGLRFQLRLVWFATVAAMLGYVWLLGWAVWIESARSVRVPRYHELIFLTALAMSGIIQGQVIRRVKTLAAEYARRLATVDFPAHARPARKEGAMSKVEAEPNPEPTAGNAARERSRRLGMLALPPPPLAGSSSFKAFPNPLHRLCSAMFRA